eukprot:COSAG05_NODE_268_length_12518_cov_6.452774_9_plen_150_part_00
MHIHCSSSGSGGSGSATTTTTTTTTTMTTGLDPEDEALSGLYTTFDYLDDPDTLRLSHHTPHAGAVILRRVGARHLKLHLAERQTAFQPPQGACSAWWCIEDTCPVGSTRSTVAAVTATPRRGADRKKRRAWLENDAPLPVDLGARAWK